MFRESLGGNRYNPKDVVRTKTVFNLPMKIKPGPSKVWEGPQLVFTSSLTDWAHPLIDPYRHEMFDIIRARKDLTYQCLTKRPERLPDILPMDWGMGYPNVWLGTSVGSDKAYKRIEDLCKVDAEVRFLSLEPLWEYLGDFMPIDYSDGSPMVNWVIVGGESGNETGVSRYRECRIEWIEDIITRCRAVGVPVFIKQLGTYLAKKLGLKDRHGGDINEWPRHLQIREFPNVYSMEL